MEFVTERQFIMYLSVSKKNIIALLVMFAIISLCSILPSINIDSLMNSTLSGKSFFFCFGIGLVIVLSLINFVLFPKKRTFNISVIDILFFAHIIFVFIQNKIEELSYSLLFYELIGLFIFYTIIRLQSRQILIWILIAILIGGIVQSVYGNLQLWGLYSSHHGLYKLTGSFFNPGPYSGYLAALFPIALGLYLFEINYQDVFSPDYFTQLKLRVSQKSKYLSSLFSTHFKFYNKHQENSSLKLQDHETKPVKFSFLKLISLISIICLCLVLPATRSRAAWLSVVFSSIFLIFIRYDVWNKLKGNTLTRVKSIYIPILCVFILSASMVWLYFFKKNSADGRLFIWMQSWEMIKDKPIGGHGYDGFKKCYMNFQADYFKNNPQSKNSYVAGDTSYAFNEFIQFVVENGIIGILPFIGALIILIFKNFKFRPKTEITKITNEPPNAQRNDKSVLVVISYAVLISVLVFSMFSYSFQILPIKICLVVCLAIIASHSTWGIGIKSFHFNQWFERYHFYFKSIILIIGFGFLIATSIILKDLKVAYTQWKVAFDLYNYGLYQDCLEEYEKAYPYLKTNGDFLTNYGKALSMAEKHEKAVSVLQQAAMYYPNIVGCTAMGDSYKKLGQFSNAEQAYLHAWYMNPSRFYPKYLLAKLYDETGQKEKAIEVANELLGKDIKIESTAIEEIKEEMKKIIEKNDSKILSENKI